MENKPTSSIPAMGQGCPCNKQDCPGPDGWELAYGMAGGGRGVYNYCSLCEEVVEKDQDHG